MKNSRFLALLCGMLIILTVLVSCNGSESAETTPETETILETTPGAVEETETPATETETAAPVETKPSVETTPDMIETNNAEDTVAEEPVTDAPAETVAETMAETEAVTEAETDYFEANRIETVTPDELKSSDVTITGDGYDIFQMKEDTDWGYRYGCTYLYNDDGTIDAYFACPGADGEWDWIAYRHSPDGGETWTPEKMVLNPTQDSMDFYSNCDPGVVYFNGYYYLGYTSTLNAKGACNNVFVARSVNPDGPFEKWNGEGWGGEHPQPICYYTTDYSKFGMGEPSFVELNGTLYIYYTNATPSGEYTMVATADATNENWPATMQFHGVAVEKNTDSLDIKYVEDWGKFVGVGTGDRMGAASWLGFYESNDGIHFELVEIVRKDTYSHLHNAGISSRRNGHINLAEDADKLRVIYAYGSGWGTWNTRVQPISLALTDKEGYLERMAAEKKEANIPDPVNRAPAVPEGERNYIMVRAQRDVYEYGFQKKSFIILVHVYDEYFNKIQLDRKDENVSFKVYDESVITIDGIKATIQGVGSTVVEVHYGDELLNVFYVNITETEKEAVPGNPPVAFEPVFDSYTIYMGERGNYRPQIRGRLWMSDDTFKEYYVEDSDVKLTFAGYDESIIDVSATGIVTAKAVGETTVTVSCQELSFQVKIIVSDNSEDAYYKMGDAPVIDYTDIDFTRPESMDAISTANRSSADLVSDGVQLTVLDTGATHDMTDPSIHIGYGNSLTVLNAEDYDYLEITYKVSADNSNYATRLQVFACAGTVTSPTADCQIMNNLNTDGEFHTLKIKLSGYSWWTGTINMLRIDFFDYALGGDSMVVSSIKLTK
ncbi:MAG: hypothetical protein E7661_01375 [Ruminococcaceae bacterium]|nr:hypothetical protein [Oscillospiraceae bacterium]